MSLNSAIIKLLRDEGKTINPEVRGALADFLEIVNEESESDEDDEEDEEEEDE